MAERSHRPPVVRQRGTMTGGLAAMLLIAVVAGGVAVGAHLLGWHLVGRLAECSPFWVAGLWLVWIQFDSRLPKRSLKDHLIAVGIAVPLIAPAGIYAAEPDQLPIHPSVIGFAAILAMLFVLFRVSARSVDAERRSALLRAAADGTLADLSCPPCGDATVSVRFTYPAATEWRTWFICSSCKFEMRAQYTGQPQHFRDDLVDRNLQERDRR